VDATYVSVAGAGRSDPELDALAADVGRLLAGHGAVVVTGGLSGVMEAAARAAHDAGGQVLGILPGDRRDEANPYCTLVVATGAGQARNLAVAATGDVMIAIGPGWGTLSEVALAGKLGRPVVTLRGRPLDGVTQVDDAEAAVREALALAAARSLG
jgi:hypothetical protein